MERESEGAERHVLVSGGSRGLGLALCAALLERGYRVSSFSRSESEAVAELNEMHEGRLCFATADMSNAGELKRVVQHAISQHGDLYGLINNAATAADGILAIQPERDIIRTVRINLEATLRLTRLCLRSMIKTRDGRVVNVGSVAAVRGFSGLSVYGATKAALDGLTRGLAREVGRRGITVNSVAPGYFRTRMSGSVGEGQMQQIVRRTPLRRLAELRDIVPVILFLMSDEASFVTAQTIVVDGGMSG